MEEQATADPVSLPMFPDEIVGKIYEEISYNKGSIKINKLWDNFKTENMVMKKFILQCCLSNIDVVLVEDESSPIPNKNDVDISLLLNDTTGKYSLQLQEDRLWIILTGYNKKECKIGNSAFELLLEIANAKEKGINTMELARATKQDPRSMTGRLKKIEYLYQSVQLIYKGHVVKKLTLNKFASREVHKTGTKNAEDNSTYISMRDHLETIVAIVKKSKNGIRQISDLRREMNFDKNKRISKSFLAAINWLSDKGFLRRVLVIPPNNPDVKVRCVQYQRDYVVENNRVGIDFEDESSSDSDDGNRGISVGKGNSSSNHGGNGGNDVAYDDDNDDDEEEIVYEGLEKANGTNLLADQAIITDEKNKVKTVIERNEMLMNRFYPIQNQTYDLSEKTGERGLSTIDAVKYICGKDFQRSYAKAGEYFLSTIGKKNVSTSGLKLIKIYDFEGKKKFHRTFTEENFNKCFDKEVPTDIGALQPLKKQKISLATLDKNNFLAISNTVRFGVNKDGEEVFFWNGEDTEDLSTSQPKRISKKMENMERLKRKKEEEAKLKEQETAKKIKVENEGTVVERLSLKEQSEYAVLNEQINKDTTTNPTSIAPVSEPAENLVNTLSVNGFQATSLASLRRQRKLLELLKRLGGFAFLREKFFDELSKMLGSATIVDKKTIDGDIRFLCSNNKVVLKIDRMLRKRYIYLPDMDSETVENFLIEDKDGKKTGIHDIISQNDIYFFDANEERKFNLESKALKRLRKFKEKTAASTKKNTNAKQKKKRKPREPRVNIVKSASVKKPVKVKVDGEVSKLEISKSSSMPKLSFILKKETIPILIKSVVITKSITKEIQWPAISRLFPKNSVGNLKKKWATRRIRMGNSGLKFLVDKWRSILVNGIKKETVTLEDVEQLHLSILLKLWLDHEEDGDINAIKLYQSYEDNKRKYILAPDSQTISARMSNVLSSMIQREVFLLKETYTVENTYSAITQFKKSELEEKIRSVIRSILIDRPNTEVQDIPALDNIPHELIEKTLVEMAREKQIYLKGSRLKMNTTVSEFFENNEYTDMFKKTASYTVNLEGILQGGNGIIVSDEPRDTSIISLIDICERRLVNIYEVPMEKQNYRFYYASRKFEIDTLTPPLILTVKDKTMAFYTKLNFVPVPLGEPYARLWLNAQGGLRETVWKQCICFIVYTILFRPGITIPKLLDHCNQILSFSELSEICNWLFMKGYLMKLPYDGYCVSNEWPRLLL